MASHRREKLILAGLLFGVLVIGLFAGPRSRRNDYDPRLTTLSAGDRGALALYLALERLGIGVERRKQPYVEADTLPRVLAVLAPPREASPAELGALMRAVEGGATLLYVASGDNDPWLDSLGLVLESTSPDSLPAYLQDEWEGRTGRPRPHVLTRGVKAVEGFRWAFADSSRAVRARRAAPLLIVEGGRPAAVEVRRGKGTVVAFADPRPFTNEALRDESGAGTVFARAAARAAAGSAPVVFDEYHQGYAEGRTLTGGMWRFLAGRPLGHAFLQLVGVGLLLLLAAGRRFGSPVPPPAARRRSPLEHVEALAGAYRQAGAKRTARRLLLAGLARRLGRRPPRDDQAEAELLARLSAHPRAGEAAAEARNEWDKGRQADLVTLTRDVDRILAEVKRP